MYNRDQNAFEELLAVLHEEELIRLRRRLQNVENHWLAGILQDELEERYAFQVPAETRNKPASV